MAICPKCGKEITLSQKELSSDPIWCSDCGKTFLKQKICDITSFEADSYHKPKRVKINESFDCTELKYKRMPLLPILFLIPLSLYCDAFALLMLSVTIIAGEYLFALVSLIFVAMGVGITWLTLYFLLKRTSISISNNGDIFIAEGAVRFWKKYQINASDIEMVRIRNVSEGRRTKHGSRYFVHVCFIQFVLKDKRIISFGEDMKENEKKYVAALLKETFKL